MPVRLGCACSTQPAPPQPVHQSQNDTSAFLWPVFLPVQLSLASRFSWINSRPVCNQISTPIASANSKKRRTCGASLNPMMMQLEEGSGTEACDAKLLEKFHYMELEDHKSKNEITKERLMSQKRWSAIVYRRGQKQLTSFFLKEAEHALDLCPSEQA